MGVPPHAAAMRLMTTAPGTTVVAFGDSITLASEQPDGKKWPQLLEASLQRDLPSRRVRVVNAGVGGNTTREALSRIEADVLAHAPDCVLAQIRQRITDHCGARIVMLTFPPVIDAWHQYGSDAFFVPWGGLNACVETYRQRTRDFARGNAHALVDIGRMMQEACDRDGPQQYILPDGVHLTAAGNAVIAAALLPELRRPR